MRPEGRGAGKLHPPARADVHLKKGSHPHSTAVMTTPTLPLRRTLVCALPLLLLLAAASVAVAVEDDAAHVDTVGDARHEWQGGGRCRGAKIRALEDTLLVGFDISTKNTEGAELRFFAYEALDDDEDYQLIPSVSGRKHGTLGDAYGWEASPRLNLKVSAHKYYALLACWDDTTAAGYRGGPKIAPQDISFGEYVGGAYFDGGAHPPSAFRPATATHDYLVRVRSRSDVAHVPFRDSDPYLLTPADRADADDPPAPDRAAVDDLAPVCGEL